MPINIEDIVERAFEQAFSKALDQSLQTKAEALFRKAFEEGSSLSKKLDEKIEEGFSAFCRKRYSLGEEEGRIQEVKFARPSRWEQGMEALIEECQHAVDQGQSPDEVMQLMHRRGLTIIEALKVFMKVYKTPIADAKEQVTASPYWREIVKTSGPLHERPVEDFEDLTVAQSRLHEPLEPQVEVEKRLSKRRKMK